MNIIPSIKKYAGWFTAAGTGTGWRLAAVSAIHLLHVAVSLVFVSLCKTLIDIATGVSDKNLALYAVFMGAAMAMQIILSVMKTRLSAQCDIKLKNGLRYRLFSRLVFAFQGEKSRKHTGDITNRLEEDVRVVAGTLSGTVPAVTATAVQFLAAFIFLCTLDSRLAWTVVIIMPAGLVMSKLFIGRTRRLTMEIRKSDSKVQSYMQESIQHITLLQALEQERKASLDLSQLQSGLYDNVMKRTNFTVLSKTLVSTAFALGYCISFLHGVFGIAEGAVTFGTMTAFLQLVGQIQRPLVDMSIHIPSLIHATTSIDRLAELEDGAEEEKSGNSRLESPAGISIEHVTFTYPEGKNKILEDFSHDFTPGSKTAILGETGAGKSTIIKLILALLKPQQGKISLYDSHRRIEADASARCNIICVPQGNSLLSGTVRENLLLGNPGAGDAEINEALHTAAAEFVYELPDGLDTQCSELGEGLSEGQAQRIAIARALLRKGSILLLDEFSSSLDCATEERLMNNLTGKMPDRTMIFITHRKKITEYCDEIIEINPKNRS